MERTAHARKVSFCVVPVLKVYGGSGSETIFEIEDRTYVLKEGRGDEVIGAYTKMISWLKGGAKGTLEL